MKSKLIIGIFVLMLFNTFSAGAQRWQREEAEPLDLMLFHSTEAFNLPTAATLQQGDFYFEMNHRFVTPISEGIGELFGFDGSVIMRLAIGYAITDRMLVKFGRSNQDGNLDLQYKWKFLQIRNDVLPVTVAFNGGVAYNGKTISELSDDSRLFQYFAHILINTMYDKKLAFGLAPGFLQNSHIYCKCQENTFALGTYAAYYIDDMWTLVAEYNPTLNGWRDKYDSFALGFELETGGHFFKFLLGNNTASNLVHYMSGAQHSFESGDWHFGFNITRNL